MKLLVANRGEIAIRIMRAAAELGVPTVAVAPADDAGSLHTCKADEALALDGAGAAAYLDVERIVAAALDTGCDALHPGYGFLAENAELARRCAAAGVTFVGPRVETLELFGDKARARAAAAAAGVPVIRGIDRGVTVEEAAAFLDALGEGRGMMIKAVAGGGGRGSRRVADADEVAAAYARCRAEAEAAFGNGALYVEEFVATARHVEVQILGDAGGAVAHLGERECSVQRNFQKIVEVAPAPGLADEARARIIDAAVRFAARVGYRNAGTFEFLVDVSEAGDGGFAFIETNARLQVEHTVTEEVTGVDIVRAQLELARGATIAELGLGAAVAPRGHAVQARVCMESVRGDGAILPASGTLLAYEPPSGPGVRTDGFGYAGYETSLAFDSLLAKVVGHSPSADFGDAVRRTSRALAEFRIEGVETNVAFLQAILAHPDFVAGRVHTRFVDEHIAELAAAGEPPRFVTPSGHDHARAEDGFAGARVDDARDPLALFKHDTKVKSAQSEPDASQPTGPVALPAPAPGTVVAVAVAEGDEVPAGAPMATINALELHHVVRALHQCTVDAVFVAADDAIGAGDPLFLVTDSEAEGSWAEPTTEVDPDARRSDLAQVDARRAYTDDDFRAEKIARRHAKQQRSPRENIEHLMDGTFREYGPLVTAASWQKQQWLRETTQADGLVMGIGHINGDLFEADRSRAVAVHYDYMVVAGTQGGRGHYKQDRIYELAGRYRLPLVLFAEGGGGRPGISGGERAEVTDIAVEAGLRKPGDDPPRSRAGSVDVAGRGGGGVPVDSYTFTKLCELSGLVPLVGVNSGRCFAGNTVMLASCDVIIAAENSTIGLGGPAMIEGGGLGIYTPEEVGPMSFQVPNGVVDILVKDDEEAIETTRKYLSYFQGPVQHWDAHDQRRMRGIVPENRSETYDMREVIATLVDKDSILEIREAFGVGIITAFIRIEGRPMGLIANNPQHLSGAIDSDAADKGARFLQLCDTFDIPVLSLMDCPGIMPGPEYERAALLRHCARLFVTGANMTTPLFGVVIRKAYGMGVRAMCGGSSLIPFFTVAWPTAEFADMPIDGRVKVMFGEELETLEDPAERQAIYERLIDAHVQRARAVNSGGTNYGIDDVIDPADTRAWIAQGLQSVPKPAPRTEKKRPNVDTW
ncbi:MAG: carbamoyl-phosphate synthase large subunit [Gammaproteobacteria bacterium]|nr:carbamoyl-phosphate synthase large subunit [Gammaproteobacteria bacterium]